MSETLYLIDGHAQFFRAYHAIRSAMTSPVTQEPTNLTFGFTGMLLKLLRDYQPDYLAVVIDVSGDRETFRSEIHPEYKANRDPPPDDFHPQVQRCLSVLEEMNVPVIGEEGVEADDVIATLVRRFQRERPNLNIRIVSKDKDLSQLLSDRVELFDVHTDTAVTAEDLFKTEGVRPEHVVGILSLMGDTIDNIQGVAGVGPKTAAKLLLQYGTIENLLEHIDEINGKRRDNIEASRDNLARNQLLVALKDDLEVDFTLENARSLPTELDAETLAATFRELGFSRHLDDLTALLGKARSGATTGEAIAESLFSDQAPPAGPSEPGEYSIIRDKPELEKYLEKVRASKEVAIDVETDSLRPLEANLCGVAMSVQAKTGIYVPTRSCEQDSHMDAETVIEMMRPVVEDENITKVGQNIKYDINVLRNHGVCLSGTIFDTMIASYVIDATRSSHKLDVLSLAFLKHTTTPLTDIIGKGKKQMTFDQAPLDQAGPYSAEDADITLRLRDCFEPILNKLSLRELFTEVEVPLIQVLAEMEYNGIRLDPDELDRQREQLGERIDALREKIIDASPHQFNPDSPRQLAVALFNNPDQDPPGLGLRPLKRGKTGPSTDVEVLEKLAANPDVQTIVPELIVEYRQLTKLVNTYLVALKEAINPHTGRVHASFNQTVAATGRLSSSEPNLQNIPIRTELGREIRRAFVAEKDHVLITADYSQIELRMLAHLAEDPALIEAFHKGEDIHRAVAGEVFGVSAEDVTMQQRATAKMVNFGIIYGVTAYGLARRLGPDVSKSDAADIIRDYKARFRHIDTFLQHCIDVAHREGYVETILKRRRAVPQIYDSNPTQRSLGERMAINTVVQGSAADLIKLAMIDLHRRLPDKFPDTKMILQIHDELVFESPRERVEEVRSFVVERMEQAMELKVPLQVESAWSENWIDAK